MSTFKNEILKDLRKRLDFTITYLMGYLFSVKSEIKSNYDSISNTLPNIYLYLIIIFINTADQKILLVYTFLIVKARDTYLLSDEIGN